MNRIKNKLIPLLLLCLLFSSYHVGSTKVDTPWWDQNYSFRQEITVPIDTGLEIAKYQPIDIRVVFDSKCWVKNTNEHSIRVAYFYNNGWFEIESQIYDLDYSKENYIYECSLVFLIPDQVDGTERYYVYYDDEEKPPPSYIDHIGIKESYYRYEPIIGYPLETSFYEVTENGYIVYAVSYDGNVIGIDMTQQVTKLKPRSNSYLPSNGEAAAGLDFWYYYDKGVHDYYTTSEELISKTVFVDGNLMTYFEVTSTTYKSDIKTTARYKYYYSPVDDKKLCFHIKHETLKRINGPIYDNYDGIYLSMQSGGLKSQSFEELNVGGILPYIHFYSDKNVLMEYKIDQNPEYVGGKWDVEVLTTRDNADLGEQAWGCFDTGETGVSHAIIFDNTQVVSSDEKELNGIQMRAYETGYPSLPGLKNNVASLLFGRNSYEQDSTHEKTIPEGFIVEFDAEFYTTETGGYKTVEKEAKIFQNLIKTRPTYSEKEKIEQKQEKHSLTIYTHLDPSFPMGSSLTALTERKFPYIKAELYKDGKLHTSDIGRRIPFEKLSDLYENSPILEKIKYWIKAVDWKNISFFKKIVFPNLEPGKYVVKIFREKPFFWEERKYIGFEVVNVEKDTKLHIFCKPEGRLSASVFDQQNHGVENAKLLLLADNVTIAEAVTDQNGLSSITAPCSLTETYKLKIIYKGFVIYEEPVKFGYVRCLIPAKKSVNINLYDVALKITDTWGLSPKIELNPLITSEDMKEPFVIVGEKISIGEYLFSDIYPGAYHLELKYKSFVLEKNIKISSDEEIDLVFPAEYMVKTRVFDSRGNPLAGMKIVITRENKTVDRTVEENGCSSFSLPPGVYTATVYDNNELVSRRKISVIDEKTVDIITIKEPWYPLIISVLMGLFVSISMFFTFIKKDILLLLKICVVALVITSFVYPWWTIGGTDTNVKTTTNMFLIPVELVTTTSSSSNVIAGEFASLPDIFRDAMNYLPLLGIISCLLVIIGIVFRKLNKKRFSLISLSFAAVVLISLLVIFTYDMYQLTEVGIGSFMGSGNQTVTIIGEEISDVMFCSWGPSEGYYLMVLSIIIILFVIVLSIRKTSK